MKTEQIQKLNDSPEKVGISSTFIEELASLNYKIRLQTSDNQPQKQYSLLLEHLLYFLYKNSI